MELSTLCYIKSNNRTLMLHRIKKKNDVHEGLWNGLGGKLLPGETPEQCVIREVEEESGLMITRPHLCGILTFPAFKDDEDCYVFLFTATEFEGSLIDSPEGRLEWIDDSKVLALPLWEGDRHFLKWMTEGRFFSAMFAYKNKKLIDHKVTFYPVLTQTL